MMESQFSKIFKESICFRISESQRMLSISLTKIEAAQLWERPNDNCLSLGNQLLHLKGNMTQYVLSILGQEADIRNRPLEFETQNGLQLEELQEELNSTLEKAKKCIQNCSEELLLKKHVVQGFHLSGIDVAVHATEHLSYHTGQIAFWAKQLINSQLGFYEGLDLNKKNS